MAHSKPTGQDVADATAMRDESARRPAASGGGEDESSTSTDGDESGLHEDQKPVRGSEEVSGRSEQSSERHKTENLTKAGRDIDPDDGSE